MPIPDASAGPRRDLSLFVALSLAAIGIACSVLPAIDLLTVGPLRWHVGVDSAVQGGIEALVVAALVFAATALPGAGWRLAGVVAVLALYLRHHAVDGPVLLVAMYLELMIAAGVLVLRVARSDTARGIARYRDAVMPGIAAIAAVFLVASMVGYGTSRNLGVVTLALMLVVFPLARVKPMTIALLQRAVRGTTIERVGFAVIATWLAVLAVKTNNALGYDSPWYGLRGHLVLAPHASLFDETGLVSPVNYFPKLNELLLLPLNRLSDFSYPFALTVGFYAFVALFAHQLARQFGADRRGAIVAMLLAASLPAVANLALTTKADILALLFLMIAAWWALRFVATRAWPDFLIALFATGFATQAKLTSAPFGVAIFASALALAFWRWHVVPPFAPDERRPTSWRLAIAIGVLLAIVAGALTWRTYVLTGLPTIGPDPLFKLWLALGFELREPVGTLGWINPQDWADVPSLVRELTFAPSRLSHVIITWTGNIWLWLTLVALVAWRAFGAPDPLQRRRLGLVAVCILAGAWLAIGQRYIERGGDGNYFMFAPVIAIIALVPSTLRVVDRARAGVALHAAIALCVAFQLHYAFVTANWDRPGTRAWQPRFDRGVVDTPRMLRELHEQAGMYAIAQWLDNRPRKAPILRLTGVHAEVEGMLLHASFEPIAQVLFARNHYFQNAETFLPYLEAARIDGVIVPHDTSNLMLYQELVINTSQWWRGLPGATVVRGEKFDLVLRPGAGESLPPTGWR